MKDYIKNQNNEYYRGKIFRQICMHADGVDAIQLGKELDALDRGMLASMLAKMQLDGLIYFDEEKEVWKEHV